MSNESQVLRVVTSTNKEPTGTVALVTEAGDTHPAAGIPELPTEDGNYQLTVASGVLSWTEIV